MSLHYSESRRLTQALEEIKNLAEEINIASVDDRINLRDAIHRNEIKNFKAALEWCSEYVFEGMDIDGGDFQDEMVRLGLLKSVPASEQQKAEYDVDDMPMRRTRLLWRAIDWVWK